MSGTTGRLLLLPREEPPVSWIQPFNRRMICYPNLETAVDFKRFPPAVENPAARVSFWLVLLDSTHYAWAGAAAPDYSPVHVFAKSDLPEEIIKRPFKISVLSRMSPDRIKSWASGIHFFQGFSWLPAGTHAANSELVWEAIAGKMNFSGKSVLDIGTNFGFFAFSASRAGAEVYGQDRNPNVLRVARFINDRIELQDVDFGTGTPDRIFDAVFYLSVHHQIDPFYKELGERLAKLRAQAREALFVELIVPPLKGRMTEAEVDRLIVNPKTGEGKLLRYRHKIRRERALYFLGGKEH